MSQEYREFGTRANKGIISLLSLATPRKRICVVLLKHLLREDWHGLETKLNWEEYRRDTREMSRGWLDDLLLPREMFWTAGTSPLLEEMKLFWDFFGDVSLIKKMQVWFLQVLCCKLLTWYYSKCHGICFCNSSVATFSGNTEHRTMPRKTEISCWLLAGIVFNSFTENKVTMLIVCGVI